MVWSFLVVPEFRKNGTEWSVPTIFGFTMNLFGQSFTSHNESYSGERLLKMLYLLYFLPVVRVLVIREHFLSIIAEMR